MNDPFMEGVKAYNEYKSRDENPYCYAHEPYDEMQWERGYNERKHGYVDEYGQYKDNEES